MVVLMSYKLSNFLGINNRLPDSALQIRTQQVQGSYLKDALNVEIDNARRLRRRPGETQVQALTAPHSLFIMSDATHGYVVVDSVLYAITLPSYTQTLVKALASNAAMSYVQEGDSLYFSNGTDSGRITAGTVYPLGLPTPAAPALSESGGSLSAGAYQVAISYSNSVTGEESGVSACGRIELALGGILVTLPAATSGATHVNVYLSDADGGIPKLATTVTVGTTIVGLSALASGRDAAMRFEAPLPAGRLFMANGRLCSHVGNVVNVGLPYRYGYYLPAEGYIPFNGDVSNAISCQGGTYIVADQTFWFPGDLGHVENIVQTVLPYGGVPGTTFAFPDKSLVGWFGEKGIVFGATSGEVQAVMTENIDLTPPASGFSVIIDRDGYDRVVSCGWCVNLENKAATRTDSAATSAAGSYITRADGIYALGADEPVDWSVDFGKLDFGNDQEKRLPNAYLGVECGEPLQLTVTADGRYGGEYTYPARGFDENLNVQRIDVGKGLRANWFNLSLSNIDGTPFKLTHIDFTQATTKRRI